MNTQVAIFGTEYTFEGEDPERVRQLADYVNRKMSETARNIRNVTSTRVAVLAAMNLADELLTLRDSIERTNDKTAQRLDSLIALWESLASPFADEAQSDDQKG